MAAGILAAQSGTIGKNTTAAVYTCPAGISHAVVHLFFVPRYGGASATSTVQMLINNRVYYQTVLITGPGATAQYSPFSASLVLSPGDVIRVGILESSVFGQSLTYDFFVSGYTVP